MVKSLLFLITVFLMSTVSNAQFVPKRWAHVFTDSTKKIYIDTTSIRVRDKQFIYWTLEIFNEPVSVPQIPEKIYRAKTQYVVNDITKKYCVIGVLYYDKIGRLTGENYNRGITVTGDVFSKSVNTDPLVKTIFNKVELFVEGKLYFGITEVPQTKHETIKASGTEKSGADRSTIKITSNRTTTEEEDSAINIEEDSFDTDSVNSLGTEKVRFVPLPENLREPEFSIGSRANRWKAILKLKRERKKIDSSAVTKKEIKEKKKTKIYTYNVKNERRVTNTIFTDGMKYVVQVSSWKNKKIAEREKEKLKTLGYNSFITQVYLKKKRGTWNRVRVGFFNTLKEAKRIEKEVKKKLR